MSRWVVPKRSGLRMESSDRSESEDGALVRIVKYVPAEVVVPFTLLTTILLSSDALTEHRALSAVGLIFLFLIVTICYLAIMAPKGEVRKAHYLVSPLAFFAWAYPISSSALGDLFLPLVAFAVQAIVIALSIFIRPVSS